LDIPHPSGAVIGDRVAVLGYALARETVPSGEEAAVTLYLRCDEPPSVDTDLVLRAERDGQIVGSTRARPAGDAHPTDAWRAGEVLRYTHTLRIDPDAPGGEYALRVDLVPRGDPDPPAGGGVLLTTLAVEHVERLFEPPTIGYPAVTAFGDAILLLGYDLDREVAAHGETLRVTLYWRALDAVDRSYTTFVHLLDASGAVRGQRDSVPVAGERPTDRWLPGEVVLDAYELAVVPDAPAGAYRLAIGLYDPATGERLPVTDAAGNADPERRLLLDTAITIE